MKEIKSILLNNFVHREDVISVYPKYHTIIKSNLEEYIDGHVNGKKRIGFYNLDQDSSVLWGVIDLDNHSNIVEIDQSITKFIHTFNELSSQLGLYSSIEISKSGDKHIWIFFNEPTNASVVKNFLTNFINLVGHKANLPQQWVREIEIFPKQASLKTPTEFGNMVWAPMFGGKDAIGGGIPDGKTIFEIDGKLETLPKIRPVNLSDLDRISDNCDFGDISMKSNALPKPVSRHNTLRDTAIKLAKIEIGAEVMRDTLYSQNKTFHEPKPDHEIDKIIEWVSETISPDTNDSHSFKLISGLEALTMKLPKREMIVEEIIGRHKVIAVAAKTNVGKSIWVHQLGLALALGLDKIFGFKISRSHKVLFLNFEMDERELIERHQLLVTGIENRNDALLENFNFNTFGGKRSLFQDNWDSIDRTVIETGPYDLIIVDNLYACTGKNDEKNHDLKSILKRIISVSDFNDSSILIVNHHKKHSDEEILCTDQVRGGSTFANAVDVIIQLAESKKESGLRLMKITKNRGRSPNRNKCIGLKMDDNLWFNRIGYVDEPFHLTAPKVPLEDEVILAELPDEFGTRDYIAKLQTKTDVTDRTGANRLNALIRDGLIQKVGHGRYKKLACG